MAPVPIQATVARIRTVEFFGVLLPGIYLMAAIGFVYVSAGADDWPTLKPRLVTVLIAEPRWLPVLLVVLASYILGSITRAFPVDRIDKRIGKLVRRVRGVNAKSLAQQSDGGASAQRFHQIYASDFPYWPFLRDRYDALVEFGHLSPAPDLVSKIPDPTESEEVNLHVAFDFWKSKLYLTEPSSIPRMQELEARTRMFCGLFWAGALASVLCLASAFWTGMWWMPLSASASLAASCAWRLRHIRCEEAGQIFFWYVINETRIPATGDPRDSPANTS